VAWKEVKWPPMIDENPYAAPAIAADSYSDWLDELAKSRGMWRDGSDVVITYGSVWPPRCVSTGEPVIQYVPLRCRWYSGWSLVWLLLGPLCLIPLLFLGLRIELMVPVGASWARRKRTYAVLGWIVVMCCALAMGLLWSEAVDVGLDEQHRVLAGIVCFGGLSLGLLLTVASCRPPLEVAQADARFVRLSGAGEVFLQSLPSLADFMANGLKP
jgi:hypothetical protein